MKEQDYDRLLGIKTEEIQQSFHGSPHFHRYEPTPYVLLDRLFEHRPLRAGDRLVDFGSGKGRLVFYSHYLYGIEAVGVEMNEGFYRDALHNYEAYLQKNSSAKGKLQFEFALAQEYAIDPRDNKFYFFNPFSAQLFMGVIQNILRSVEAEQREVELILFFASGDYIDFLENRTSFELVEEVDLPGSEWEVRERFLIYRLPIAGDL
jgi:hypothetical protein